MLFAFFLLSGTWSVQHCIEFTTELSELERALIMYKKKIDYGHKFKAHVCLDDGISGKGKMQ